MKVGEQTVCPHCGESTIAKKKILMDAWTKSGEILICPLCSGKLADLNEGEITDNGRDDKKSVNAFASLLGGDDGLNKPKFEVDGTEKPFCRDCRHYISHPFMDRCTLHNKVVNPMDDCADFEAKNK